MDNGVGINYGSGGWAGGREKKGKLAQLKQHEQQTLKK